MQLSQLLKLENTHCSVQCSSKKRALEIISELASPTLSIATHELFEILLQREKMGSTAIGCGIAIPHGKLAKPDAPISAYFLQLENGIDFEAVDNQPVDLLFALFIPENECKSHHQILSLIAQHLSDKNTCRQLRNATTDEQLYQILTEKDIVC
jgi:PTS system nitrogen regulatory IIA component